MRKEVKDWMRDAEYDLDCAKVMQEHGKFNYAVFFSRQALEKALKACYLAILRKPIAEEHNLLKLARDCFGLVPAEIEESVRFLNPHYVNTRYVNAATGLPSELFDAKFGQQAIERGMEALVWLKKTLGLGI